MTEHEISIAASDASDARARREEERRHWLSSHPSDPLPRPIDPNGPVLSVVVTVHNVGPWIDELLQSLKAQTLTDVEFLLVDDHSVDESAAAVDAAAASDSRFTVIRPLQQGGAHARNVGADHARGRLLAFCDGDDIVPENAYASLVAAIDGHDIVFGDYLKFFPDRIWHPTRTTFDEPRTGITLADHPDLLDYRAVWNKVFQTSFWREHDIVFPEVVRSNDIVPMVTAYVLASSIATITDTVYRYRDRPGNTSMTSKVGTGISLRSYLRQEQACAEILEGHPVQPSLQRLFAGRDGWVQVSRYIAELDGDPVEPEILARVRALWDLVSPAVRDEIPPERRALFEALAGPDPDRATDTVRALKPAQAATTPSTRLAAAERVLERNPAMLERIVTGIRRLLLEDTEPARHANALRSLLAAIDDGRDTVPRKVRNLDVRTHGALSALRDNNVEEFTTRLGRARSFVMEVAEVSPTRGGLRLSGTISGPADLTPERIIVRGKDEPHRIASVQIDPGDRSRWTARLGQPTLPSGRKHRLDVVGRLGSDEEMFHLAHAANVKDADGSIPGAMLEIIAPADPFVTQLRWTPRPRLIRRTGNALRRRLGPWIRGARPRTLPAAVAPVLAGTGAAALADGVVAWKALTALGVSLALQVGVNYANDYSDGVRGTDDNRVGPLRLVGSGLATPQAVKRAAQLSLLVGAGLGLVLAATTSWWLLLIGVAALLAAWTYTGGANPYGYRGLGELSVFVFFGLVAVVGTTFVQLERVTWPSIAAGVAVGALACAILVANNLRDIATDVDAGKRTVAVRLGDTRTRWLYVALGLVAWASVAACGVATPWALLGLAGVGPWLPAVAKVRSGAGGLNLVPVLAQTGIAELVAAAGLGVGFALGG